ncbi:hypothetical protein PHYSODRAFT_306971 [Phytophthora sojae]|uniref:RxLR effector protein n=1 Tax=Phytophthora sojae (strain P6497) TaxID=1094619 RepID=G5ABW9_PHYSP|nr:hypothetical protein PHYSODRAFT_306971 [Phytophthora sojae]EGZ06844.1 hypothetical protein PHYSODRAFT_306971 [Phytophthora sojae]|eukprot:XP_009537608.1 hypothetical protein PHYSODRAFT_306971 [Phytophthora sojae]
MRVNHLLLLAAAAFFASAHAASATANTEQTKMIWTRETGATSRFLGKHGEAHAGMQDDGDGEEERAFNLEMIANWFKSFGSEKLDDVAPKMNSEMNNLNKLDDVVDAKKLDDVVDAKKLDDTADLKKLNGAKNEISSEEMDKTFVQAFDDWKTRKFSLKQAAQEMRDSGVKDEAAIEQVMIWYYIFATRVK